MLKENFVKYLETSIKKHWDMPALSDYEGKTYTFAQTAEDILNLHCLFETCGIKRGDKIALIGKNSYRWSVVYLATVSYGAVIVPLLADFKPKDIHHLVNHSEALLLFSADSIFEKIESSEMPALHAVFSLTDFSIAHDRKGLCSKIERKKDRLLDRKRKKLLSAEKFELPQVGNHELLGILYTSGTSGFSKGVMLQHNNLAANMRYAQANMPLVKGDTILSFLPQAHAYGCAFEFLYPFTLGCHITFLSRMPSPRIIVAAFKKVKPRLILSVPLIIEKLYKKQIKPTLEKPAMKLLLKIPGIRGKIYNKVKAKLNDAFGANFHEVVIGGAALNKEVEIFLRKIKFRFSTGYGMTECGPLIAYANWDKNMPFSCGRPVDTLEVKIDSDTPESKVGEILVRGENVMTGYYKNEVATREALDKDGWLHTGDLGTLGKDGSLYIKGRSKSMILGPSGQNIYPEEAEAVISNLPLVQEALVVENHGKLTALIYPDKDTKEELELNQKQMVEAIQNYREQINKELPKYMQISEIKIVREEFAKTPKKSIRRFLYTSPNFEVHTLQ